MSIAVTQTIYRQLSKEALEQLIGKLSVIRFSRHTYLVISIYI